MRTAQRGMKISNPQVTQISTDYEKSEEAFNLTNLRNLRIKDIIGDKMRGTPVYARTSLIQYFFIFLHSVLRLIPRSLEAATLLNEVLLRASSICSLSL